jgi:hypothetical protein
MQRRTILLLVALIAVVAIASVLFTNNRVENGVPGQPSPHALDQSN